MPKQTNSNVPKIRFKGFEGGWDNTTFQTACSLLTGHPFQSKQFTKSGFFLVRGMNVKRGYVDDSEQISEFWSSSIGLEAFLLKEDDIVIQMDGALIGRSYAKVRQENLPALLVQRVTRARCESTSNSEYIYQYIERDFLKYIRATKTETAVPHLSLNDIRQFPISTSTPSEQIKIGGYFRELDRLIGLHQRKHDKLVTLKKAMLQKMFPQPGAASPEIRFTGFSGKWKEGPVSTLLTERNVQAPKSDQYPLMAFVAGQGVAPKGKRYNREFLVSDEVNKKYKQTELGDFIYSSNNLETGSIGINKFGCASISPVYSIFSPTQNADSDFIGQLLCQRSFICEMVKWRQGVVYGQWRIPESDFLRIETTFPFVDEQKKIGAYFRTLDELISKHATQLQKLQQIKSACLEKMFV